MLAVILATAVTLALPDPSAAADPPPGPPRHNTPVVRVSAPPSPIQDNSFLLEEAYNQEPGVIQHVSTFQRNSGVGWALDFKNGLQVVPGLSVPLGVGPSQGQRSFFLYLSLEHPLWNAR